jgi:MerR family transcriptional regulator, light-induced transcriptional regulator
MPSSEDVTDSNDGCVDNYYEQDRYTPPSPGWTPRPSMEGLAETIESQIIPRLLMVHGPARAPDTPAAGSPGTVGDYVAVLLSHDSAAAVEFVEAEIRRGVGVETLLLELMAPAARKLGDMWTDDECDFVDVTLGLTRMQQMVRKLRPGDGGMSGAGGIVKRALLVPAPGEQHTFGLRIVEEFLIRAGWDVRSNLRASQDEVMGLLESENFDVVGFSLSGETLIGPLVSTIRNLRQISLNRSICVMVGGVRFAEQPGLAQEIGADFAASDAPDAVRRANAWPALN